MNMARDLLSRLARIYERIAHLDSPQPIWLEERQSLQGWPWAFLDDIGKLEDRRTLAALSKRAVTIGELLILDASCSDEAAAVAYIRNLREILNRFANTKDIYVGRLAEGILTAMMIGLEVLPQACQEEIIECLCEIVDVDIGAMPKWRGLVTDKSKLSGRYGDILHGALYAEVLRFIRLRQTRQLEKQHQEIVEGVKCPVISVGSRKGGTGKSLFLLACLHWLNSHASTKRKSAKVCVVDLDFSGPIWQYFLFPKRNEPKHFLDDYLHCNQDPRNFVFPQLTRGEVLKATVQAKFPFGYPGSIGHLGIRDIPGINRPLALGAELNRPAFYKFLAEVVAVLSEQYDYVVIDNSPGFDGIAYASMGLACSAKRGAAIVLSSPAFPDLAGTFLELADYRLARVARPPVWVVNKATELSLKYTKRKHTAIEIAQELQAYDGVLPDTPLLKKVLRDSKPVIVWENVRMDPKVADFMFVDAKGIPKRNDIFSTTFTEDVGKILESIHGTMMC